ncbi:MAG: hypothetical protein JSS83_23335 [Cyanobacteria bacterium SZAS LIN-3]|nr:hypothetical protein [Cyanobacteria bacterium SZAS LIN-3]MBS2010562.1 hypothetical protein [Cyanobacteria bacterium SZAS TMP-1]
MARNSSDKKGTRVTVALSLDDRVRLEKFSHALGLTPSELVRQAVREMLQLLENPAQQVTEEQSLLAHRMEKFENRMAALLARVARATAQTLYFTALPYRHGGLPREPLTPRAMNHLWGQSGQFAGEWLRNKHIEQEAPTEGNSNEAEKSKDSTI